MLEEFLTWWGRQLVALVPARLRGAGAPRDGTVLRLTPALDAAELRGRRVALSAPGVRGPLDLALPPGRVLEQSVTLPLAAERDVARVLRYEMDRLTPFAADDLFWSWRITGRDRVQAQLRLVLSLVPRAVLAPVLAALEGTGARPVRLRSGDVVIPLQQEGARPWQRRVRLGLAALCTVLAVGTVAVPFVLQSRESRRVERQIAGLRPAVDQAEALRRTAAAAVAGVDVLAAQRAESGSVLAMLAALTEALPDDTSVTDLAYRARVATVTGQSAAAVRLIPALAADPALRGPAFTAPVTRNETTGAEGFTLRTELAP